jgi:hypothetical protein
MVYGVPIGPAESAKRAVFLFVAREENGSMSEELRKWGHCSTEFRPRALERMKISGNVKAAVLRLHAHWPSR